MSDQKTWSADQRLKVPKCDGVAAGAVAAVAAAVDAMPVAASAPERGSEHGTVAAVAAVQPTESVPQNQSLILKSHTHTHKSPYL